ncbi:MAG: hypothetical protein AAGB00_11250 [Planctomycetota bacterium]
MTFFLENSAPIWVAGALGLTMTGIVYASLRTAASMAGIAVVLLLLVGALALEHFWQTPGERVQAALEGLMRDVEADDLPAVLARLSPTATQIRDDAELLMPQFEVEKARVTGSIEVTFPTTGPSGGGAGGATASATAKVFVQARHRRQGFKGGDFTAVTFGFERRGDRWLVRDYSVSEAWRKKSAQLRGGR